MKTVTDKFLARWDACQGGVEWLQESGKRKAKDVIELLIEQERFNWAQWLIVRLLPTKKDRVRYAIYCAEMCIKAYEDKYDDKRPRRAIQAAKQWCKNPTDKNKQAVYSASSAANVKMLRHGLTVLLREEKQC